MTARYTIGCPCPACGSLDIRPTRGGRLRCDNCASTWSIKIILDQTVHVHDGDEKNGERPTPDMAA